MKKENACGRTTKTLLVEEKIAPTITRASPRIGLLPPVYII